MINMFDLGKAVVTGALSFRSENANIDIAAGLNNRKNNVVNNINNNNLSLKIEINFNKHEKEDNFIIPIIKY